MTAPSSAAGFATYASIFLATGSLAMVARFVAEHVGPTAAGVAVMFPVVLASTAVGLLYTSTPETALRAGIGALGGIPALCAFAIAFCALVRAGHRSLALPVALAAWAVAAVPGYLLAQRLAAWLER